MEWGRNFIWIFYLYCVGIYKLLIMTSLSWRFIDFSNRYRPLSAAETQKKAQTHLHVHCPLKPEALSVYFQTCLSRAIFNPEKYVDGFFFPQNGTEGVNVSTDYIYRTFPVTKLSKTNGPACVSLQRVNSGFFVCRKYGCLCYGFLETQYLIRRNSTHFFLLTHCLRDGAARMLEQRVILGEVFFYYKCKVMSQE